ncbi:MAG TPA: hypothetical protein VMU57_10645 [Edaphobacter sp.]|uniref:hypothetical protein n=1 Tax=Edaphobacter sp. TaxID=1934404 RepID=UPI002CDE3F73|nr:hypothetical protein [Edaphobacter sp.]HUZ95361.1 hypothetical protein [Edaphobacter sp.]
MNFSVLKRKGVLLLVAAALALAIPPTAKALGFDVFSAIESTITGEIGGALTAMNGIQNSLRQDQQTLLFPVALINQAHSYVITIMGSYRGWMSGVFRLPVNSAQLTANQNLEHAFLSGSSASLGNMNALYTASFGALPTATAAPKAHRQMMDMNDALAKDALARSVAADQATTSLIQMANQIENETATTAPGTADMLSATARAAELESLAAQHRLLASMLREEAANLAYRNGLRKQRVIEALQVNSNLKETVAAP